MLIALVIYLAPGPTGTSGVVYMEDREALLFLTPIFFFKKCQSWWSISIQYMVEKGTEEAICR
jgi:hypothetical protein